MNTNTNQQPCPACTGTAFLVTSQHHGDFFKCRCDAIFASDHGRLVPPTNCPKCGQKRLSRFEAAQHPGHFFHMCGACETFFYDDAGQPGRPFQA